jgi:tetraacyldisaccharide 4'-kinase
MNPPFSPEELRDDLKGSLPGRLLLRALSGAYSAAVGLRRRLYASGVLRSRRLPVPVICFGNISAGGTGKTSTVVAVARELARAGRRPAVLIRGYRRAARPSSVAVLARGRRFTLEETGDEALMLYRMLEDAGVPVVVSSDRYKAGLAAVELGADLLLMDDGFQHFALRRDADIVLVNATSPFSSDHVLPYGNLREPASGLARAAAVIITHCERASQASVDLLRNEILAVNPDATVIESMHSPEKFLDPATARPVDLDAVRGRPAAALSGIGDPASFEAALAKLKIDLKQIWRYPDHHAFTNDELASAQAARAGLPLITTYKDYARFPEGWQDILHNGVLIFSVKIVFLCDGWKNLMRLVQAAAAPRGEEA